MGRLAKSFHFGRPQRKFVFLIVYVNKTKITQTEKNALWQAYLWRVVCLSAIPLTQSIAEHREETILFAPLAARRIV